MAWLKSEDSGAATPPLTLSTLISAVLLLIFDFPLVTIILLLLSARRHSDLRKLGYIQVVRHVLKLVRAEPLVVRRRGDNDTVSLRVHHALVLVVLEHGDRLA